jgi:CHAD domain-containing protein
MKHTEIRDILECRYQKIEIAFNKVMEGFGTDEIHLFRVEVKKLRAFLKLVRTIRDGTHAGKLPARLRKFYGAIGIVRNLQVQEQRILTESEAGCYVLPRQYLHLLEEKKTIDIAAAGGIASGKAPFRKGMDQVGAILPGKLNPKMIKRFVSSEISALERLLTPVYPDDESLHLVRKLIKDLQYTWTYIIEDLSITLSHGLPAGKDDIKRIAARLGDFQDISDGLELLNADNLIRVDNEEERSVLQHIGRKWREENENARPELYELLKKTCIQYRC